MNNTQDIIVSNTGSGTPLNLRYAVTGLQRIVAQPSAKYQIIDQATGKTPEDILFRREANDLRVYVNHSEAPSLIIENFYDLNVPEDRYPDFLVDTSDNSTYLLTSDPVGSDDLVNKIVYESYVDNDIEAAFLPLVAAGISPLWGLAAAGVAGTALLATPKGGGSTAATAAVDPPNNNSAIGTVNDVFTTALYGANGSTLTKSSTGTVNITGSVADSIAGDTVQHWRSGDIVTITENGTTIGSATIDATGHYTLAASVNILEGFGQGINTYTATVLAHDSLGNVGTLVAHSTYLVETIAPSPSNDTFTTSISTPTLTTSNTSTVISGSVANSPSDSIQHWSSGDVVTLTEGTATIGTATIDSTGHYTFTATGTALTVLEATQGVDTYTATVVAKDQYGNLGTLSSNASYIVDTLNPPSNSNLNITANLLEPTTNSFNSTIGSTTASITGVVSSNTATSSLAEFTAGDVVSTVLNGHTYSATVAANGSYTITGITAVDLEALPQGVDSFTVSIAALDQYNVAGTATGSNSYTYVNIPSNNASNGVVNDTFTTSISTPTLTTSNTSTVISGSVANSPSDSIQHWSSGDVVTLTEGTATIGTATIDSTGHYTFTATGTALTVLEATQGVDTYTATVVAKDQYGNHGTLTSGSSYTYYATPSETVAITMLGKDSGSSAADFTTNDGSAGHLLSGTLSAALQTGEVVDVFANGVLIGTANVSGKNWLLTDTQAYSGNWTYTAEVVNAVGTAGTIATQVVTYGASEAAPTIVTSTDSAAATIANAGTTTNSMSTVRGTGHSGDIIYLYDNTSTNLVGTATVNSAGSWSVNVLGTDANGSNLYDAKEINPSTGNLSVFSNTYTVNSAGSSIISNGDFSNGLTGWTPYSTVNNTATSETSFYGGPDQAGIMPVSYLIYGTVANNGVTPSTFTSSTNSGSGSMTVIDVLGGVGQGGNPMGSFAGNFFAWNDQTITTRTVFLSQNVNVVAGQTYHFSFDFESWGPSANSALLVGFGSSTCQYAVNVPDPYVDIGHVNGTYVASTTGSIPMYFSSAGLVDLGIDNISLVPVSPSSSDGSLVAGGTAPVTASSNTLTYTGGTLQDLGGDDILTVGTNIQSQLAAGGSINGGAGENTLVLAASTTLNLEALTVNDTIPQVQQFQVLTLQGNSTLTLDANDVLALGTVGAASYAFSSTTGGAASVSSAGKVQEIINGTSTDVINLHNLLGSNHTAQAGTWVDEGHVTVNGHTYEVFNHSTTNAQVLIDQAVINASHLTHG